MADYVVLQCSRPDCRLRFPDIGRARLERCPRCEGPLEKIEIAFQTDPAVGATPEIQGPRVSVLMDNLRSAFNVGAILRTADGAGIEHAYLCGITPTPENPKVTKTALSAEFALPWSYHTNAVDIARDLHSQGGQLWALESGSRSVPIFDVLADPHDAIILIAGNELAGVDPDLILLCERVVRLPMVGFKRSLNVAIATGIAIYLLRFGHLRTG